MYVCIYIYICIYLSIYVCIYIHPYIHTYIHSFIHIHKLCISVPVCEYIYIYKYGCLDACALHVHVYVYTHKRAESRHQAGGWPGAEVLQQAVEVSSRVFGDFCSSLKPEKSHNICDKPLKIRKGPTTFALAWHSVRRIHDGPR